MLLASFAHRLRAEKPNLPVRFQLEGEECNDGGSDRQPIRSHKSGPNGARTDYFQTMSISVPNFSIRVIVPFEGSVFCHVTFPPTKFCIHYLVVEQLFYLPGCILIKYGSCLLKCVVCECFQPLT